MVLSGAEPEAAVVGTAAERRRRVEAGRAPSPAPAPGDGEAPAAAHVLARARLGAGGGTGLVVFVLCKDVKGGGEVRVEHVSDRHGLSHDDLGPLSSPLYCEPNASRLVLCLYSSVLPSCVLLSFPLPSP